MGFKLIGNGSGLSENRFHRLRRMRERRCRVVRERMAINISESVQQKDWSKKYQSLRFLFECTVL